MVWIKNAPQTELTQPVHGKESSPFLKSLYLPILYMVHILFYRSNNMDIIQMSRYLSSLYIDVDLALIVNDVRVMLATTLEKQLDFGFE